jgi:hypothetical protein
MSHHENKGGGNASTTGRPENWDRDEMKRDRAGGAEPATDDDPAVPAWKEGQMARERPDGSRDAGPSDEEIEAESKGGLSGGGTNPGGGERWAERDKR